MMKNQYAIVHDGNVLNIVVYDGQEEWVPTTGTELVEIPPDIFVDIGYIYLGGKFSPPAE
ncbi:hypothetical protein [Ralstonia mannitolilytica]|uniref:hypothetical protein n=1 Tax=Ralstonia mannitolilytica TaxID=105219 RepID=UPI0039B57D4D